LPLLERARVEVYVPDLSAPVYRDLLLAFEEEFTYAFGGCTIVKGLAGSYLSHAGVTVPDRINLIYTDLPFALSTNFQTAASYTRQLKEAVHAVLPEETVLVAACQVYHSV
jgi:hypothetical protein